jgi:hypothetical protein
MTKIQRKMTKAYVEFERAEEQLHNTIQELPEFGEECVCDVRDSFNFIHYGDDFEIQTYCLNCGGYC